MFDKTRLELPEEAKQATIDHFESHAIDGVKVYFGTELAQGVPELFGVGETIGLVFAAIVLIVTLGSLIAAALPIVTALVGVAIGVTASLAFSGVVNMASVTPVLGVMLGLAVGIDYSLFIVYRHRKQLIRGVPAAGVDRPGDRHVGHGGRLRRIHRIVALLALNVTGIPFLGLMGTVGAVCVGVAVLVAITLAPGNPRARRPAAPASQDAAPDRQRARHAPADEADHADVEPARDLHARSAPSWSCWSIAIPSMSMRLGLPDGVSEPAGSTSYQAYEIIEEEFGAGVNGPLLVVRDIGQPRSATMTSSPPRWSRPAARRPRRRGRGRPDRHVRRRHARSPSRSCPKDGPNSESTEQLVRTCAPVAARRRRPRWASRAGQRQHRHLARSSPTPCRSTSLSSSACRSSS